MRLLSRIATGLRFAAASLLLMACATTSAPRLDGTTWRLTAWSVSSLDPRDFSLSAEFTRGQVAGRSAVNQYFGTVRLDPGNGIAVGPLISTRMAGPEPAMRAEGIYLELLANAKSYRIDDGRLTLFDGNGNESLVFSRKGSGRYEPFMP